MASAPKTRARPNGQPVAAPQAFPSPHSDSDFTPRAFPAAIFADHVIPDLDDQIRSAIHLSPPGNHRDIVETSIARLRAAVLAEIDTYRTRTLQSLGLPVTGKRRSNDDYIDDDFEPASKLRRTNQDDGDDEEAPPRKGGWKCLYYEHDPQTYAQCGSREYKRVSELRRHIKTHTLPHCCENCGYRTAEERRLANHRCEDGNRKRYAPITPEERIKHERLMHMGIKVGQMKQILFGKADSVGDEDVAHSDESLRASSSHGVFLPTGYDGGFQPPPAAAQHPHPQMVNLQMQDYQQPTFTAAPSVSPHNPPTSTFPSHPITTPILRSQLQQTTPFDQISPIQHSPYHGHAGSYYAQDFPLLASPNASPTPIGGHMPPHSQSMSDASNLSPLSNPHISPVVQHHSYGYPQMPPQQFKSEPGAYPDQQRSDGGLQQYLQSTFPELSDDHPPVLTRRIPSADVRSMERILASRNLTPMERQATGLFVTKKSSTKVGFFLRIKRKIHRPKSPTPFLPEDTTQTQAAQPTQPPQPAPGSISFWKRLTTTTTKTITQPPNGAAPAVATTTTTTTTIVGGIQNTTKKAPSSWASRLASFFKGNKTPTPATVTAAS